MIKSVCVYASSSNFLDDSYNKQAQELGRLLAEAGMDMVYGGSCLGLMWQCANEVKQAGRKLIGVMPKKLKDMDVYSDYCDELHITSCMRTRKAQMDKLSDALVTLPGGFGTLEELAEMIVQKQLGYNNKAIVILNTNGFYDKMLKFFDEIIEQKFANEKSRNLYFVAKSPHEAVSYLKNYDENKTVMTEEDIYLR